MLPEPLRLLISAYAIGDLTPRRKKAAERLLRHSKEARRLLRELRETRRRLRKLPRPELPPNFANAVLEKVADQPPIISPTLARRFVGGRRSLAAPIATAAAILLAVGMSTYLLATLPAESPVRTVQAPAPEPPIEVASVSDVEVIPDEVQPTPAVVPDRVIAKATSAPPPPDQPKRPKARTPDPLGNAPSPLPQLVRVTAPRLPTAFTVRGMSQETRGYLRRELDKAEAQHVDLFCRDTHRGYERLLTALKNVGVTIATDAPAKEALKRKFHGQYLLYCDDLTPAEWAQVLQRAGGADRAAENRKAGDGVLDRVVVLPFDPSDQKDLTALFGTDPRQGGGKSETKAAFATAMPAGRSLTTSKESRQFLDARRPRTEGTIAVVLVIRQPGA
jgi:anti-sigma factor RsiW